MKMYGAISEWGERTFVREHLLCKRRNLEANWNMKLFSNFTSLLPSFNCVPIVLYFATVCQHSGSGTQVLMKTQRSSPPTS
jgi:hypothetical protein